MSTRLPPKEHPFVMLVEGRDDVFAIANLLQRHDITFPATPWYPLIKPFHGVDTLLDTLAVSLKTRSERLALIVDADMDTTARWAAIRARFGAAGVELPQALTAGGTVLKRSTSWPPSVSPERLGIWIMPNNRDIGGLEGFLRELVPNGDPVWEHAAEATRVAGDLGAPAIKSHFEKASLHTWLAWQEPPGLPFGTALTARVLTHDASIARAFVDWVRAVFA